MRSCFLDMVHALNKLAFKCGETLRKQNGPIHVARTLTRITGVWDGRYPFRGEKVAFELGLKDK